MNLFLCILFYICFSNLGTNAFAPDALTADTNSSSVVTHHCPGSHISSCPLVLWVFFNLLGTLCNIICTFEGAFKEQFWILKLTFNSFTMCHSLPSANKQWLEFCCGVWIDSYRVFFQCLMPVVDSEIFAG